MRNSFILLISIFFNIFTEYPTYMIINQPVVDLRTAPIAIEPNLTLPTTDLTNPLQETQLLLHERIIAHYQMLDENNESWLFVSALQQPSFKNIATWHNYPGWIKKNQATANSNFAPYSIVVNKQHAALISLDNKKITDLSIGTKLPATRLNEHWWQTILPDNTIGLICNNDVYQLSPIVTESLTKLRQDIIQTALQFLGSWYSWGGRSAQHPDYISSVDCSALVNLSFAAHGLQIPRMSHEQFLMSKHLKTCSDLQPGDFIYFVSITREAYRMDHVMMYIGNDQILESTPADDSQVRITSFQERMGFDCSVIKSGDLMNINNYEFYVYFGSLLHDTDMVQHWRNELLKYEY